MDFPQNVDAATSSESEPSIGGEAMGQQDEAPHDELMKFYIRTTPTLRSRMQRLVLDVGAARAFGRGKLTQEVALNAMLLMLSEEDPEILAGRLVPYIS